MNATRRHLAQGTKGVIYQFYAEASAAWEAVRRQTQEEANRKRSEAKTEAIKNQERGPGGKFGPSGSSIDEPLGEPPQEQPKPKRSRETYTSTKKAKAAGVSGRTMERAHALVKNRRDLAVKVKENEITLNEAMRQMKKAEVAQKVRELPEGKYRVIYADPPWSSAVEHSSQASLRIPPLRHSLAHAFSMTWDF